VGWGIKTARHSSLGLRGGTRHALAYPVPLPFVDSDSRLPEDAPWEGAARSKLGRVLVVAIVIAVAASAAALLVS
jgi:hypothetical protein